MEQVFSKLKAGDVEFVSKCRLFGASLLKQHLKSKFSAGYALKDLDVLLDMFIDGELKVQKNAFINGLGVLFGDFLTQELKMKWTIVEDQYGRDYATTITRLKITTYPIHTVMQAIEQQKHGALYSVFSMVQRKKAELSAK